MRTCAQARDCSESEGFGVRHTPLQLCDHSQASGILSFMLLCEAKMMRENGMELEERICTKHIAEASPH